ncbi:MAG: hypothetical protein ACOX8A_05825 [Thermacetogeniaceae bacterium]|jgi:hypothetical protein
MMLVVIRIVGITITGYLIIFRNGHKQLEKIKEEHEIENKGCG